MVEKRNSTFVFVEGHRACFSMSRAPGFGSLQSRLRSQTYPVLSSFCSRFFLARFAFALALDLDQPGGFRKEPVAGVRRAARQRLAFPVLLRLGAVRGRHERVAAVVRAGKQRLRAAYLRWLTTFPVSPASSVRRKSISSRRCERRCRSDTSARPLIATFLLLV